MRGRARRFAGFGATDLELEAQRYFTSADLVAGAVQGAGLYSQPEYGPSIDVTVGPITDFTRVPSGAPTAPSNTMLYVGLGLVAAGAYLWWAR